MKGQWAPRGGSIARSQRTRWLGLIWKLLGYKAPEAPARKDFTFKAVDRKHVIQIFCLTDITKCRIFFKCTENALLLRANEINYYELMLVQKQTFISWKNCSGWGVCPRTIVSTLGLINMLVGGRQTHEWSARGRTKGSLPDPISFNVKERLFFFLPAMVQQHNVQKPISAP